MMMISHLFTLSSNPTSFSLISRSVSFHFHSLSVSTFQRTVLILITHTHKHQLLFLLFFFFCSLNFPPTKCDLHATHQTQTHTHNCSRTFLACLPYYFITFPLLGHKFFATVSNPHIFVFSTTAHVIFIIYIRLLLLSFSVQYYNNRVSTLTFWCPYHIIVVVGRSQHNNKQ